MCDNTAAGKPNPNVSGENRTPPQRTHQPTWLDTLHLARQRLTQPPIQTPKAQHCVVVVVVIVHALQGSSQVLQFPPKGGSKTRRTPR